MNNYVIVVDFNLRTVHRQRSWHTNPWLPQLTYGTWYASPLVGKECMLVCEVGKYQLDIVRLIPMYNSGSVFPALSGQGRGPECHLCQ